MELVLRSDEATLLGRILEWYLGELKAEISNTENYEMREQLKQEEETVKGLLERLGQLVAAGSSEES